MVVEKILQVVDQVDPVVVQVVKEVLVQEDQVMHPLSLLLKVKMVVLVVLVVQDMDQVQVAVLVVLVVVDQPVVQVMVVLVQQVQ